MRHTISGAGGVRLHISEHGDATGKPILFIHGWSQSELCWMKQYEASELSRFRLLGLDLRGHGMSERPSSPADYTKGDVWAEDIAAVIDQLGLEKPILVGWSYGGFAIGDYLNRFGDDDIGGINLVAAAIVLNADAFGSFIGPSFFEHVPGASTPELAENIRAIRAFLRASTAEPLDTDDFETFLAFNMVVPHWVRRYMTERELDFGSTYGAVDARILVTHGSKDTVVLPAMSKLILDHCRDSRASWYDSVGHAPFIESSERFNRELADFAGAH